MHFLPQARTIWRIKETNKFIQHIWILLANQHNASSKMHLNCFVKCLKVKVKDSWVMNLLRQLDFHFSFILQVRRNVLKYVFDQKIKSITSLFSKIWKIQQMFHFTLFVYGCSAKGRAIYSLPFPPFPPKGCRVIYVDYIWQIIAYLALVFYSKNSALFLFNMYLRIFLFVMV